MLLDTLSGEPGGLLRLVDRDGALYDQVIDALESANLILSDASRAASYVPGQMPQAAAMLSELRTALETAQDVLTSLTNNPLLRDGIPEKVNPNTAGTANRGGLSW
jgi:phospholipid/cholesterol/gamma-HCH transport system substrate-binding protein